MRGATLHADGKCRCSWCTVDPLYIDYHDREWGVAVRDDRRLFEMLCLESAQAGLSWITILRKREAYRAAFDDFDPERMARYGAAKRQRLLANPGIVRNRLKVDAFIGNARAYLDLGLSRGGFSAWLWEFTDSEAMSQELKRRGFRFVGPTICHAFRQAVGMINEHETGCWWRAPPFADDALKAAPHPAVRP